MQQRRGILCKAKRNREDGQIQDLVDGHSPDYRNQLKHRSLMPRFGNAGVTCLFVSLAGRALDQLLQLVAHLGRRIGL